MNFNNIFCQKLENNTELSTNKQKILSPVKTLTNLKQTPNRQVVYIIPNSLNSDF